MWIPLIVASGLWQQSRERYPAVPDAYLSKVSESEIDRPTVADHLSETDAKLRATAPAASKPTHSANPKA